MTLSIISVGKPSSLWGKLSEEYLTRARRYVTITYTSIKDAPATLSIAERKEQETQRICANLSTNIIPIELHPTGKQYTSEEFAHSIEQWTENRTKIPTFLIAGTFGFARNMLPAQRAILSLGVMTFTHEMTIALLTEQIYRAYTILNGVPYHH